MEVNHFNQLLKVYKQLHPELTHAAAQIHVKEYFDSIKQEENIEEIVYNNDHFEL